MPTPHAIGARRRVRLGVVAVAAVAAFSACVPAGVTDPDSPAPAADSPTTTASAPTTSPATSTPTPASPGTRDPFSWPFSADSPWNTPLGSAANYVAAQVTLPTYMGSDRSLIVRSKATDPLRPVIVNWTNFGSNRCGTSTDSGIRVHIPDDLFIPDATQVPYSTPNNPLTIIAPDGHTTMAFNVAARCLRDANGKQPGQPGYGVGPIDYRLYAVPAPDSIFTQDLQGPGIYGGHGGSWLSGMGGHIRTGELFGDQPIRHALAVNLWGAKNLHYDASRPSGWNLALGKGYRWPAYTADGNAAHQYFGTNPELVMGSLLALDPSLTPERLGLETDVGRKVFFALQNYGAYVVDDTGWDDIDWNFEREAALDYEARTGTDFGERGTAERRDLDRMVFVMSVVSNNASSNVGGGGTPRQPLAPPFT